MDRDNQECFVIMPFGGNESNKKLYSQLVYEHIIMRAFKKAHWNGTRIDKEFFYGTLKDTIKTKLQNAAVVIADISGNNPNVLFELGFRHAQGKPIICISDTTVDPAFWPSSFRIIDYTRPDAVDNLAQNLSYLYRKVVKTWRTSVALEKLNDYVCKIRQAVDDNNTFMNPLQDRVAAWRLNWTRRQLKSIADHDWLCEVKDKASYVRYMREGALNLLEAGDQFLTITNLRFWASHPESQRLFLRANIEAAKRGVIIKRLFLIDRNEWHRGQTSANAEILQILKPHLHAGKEIADGGGPGALTLKCYISDNFRQDLVHYGHFALLCDSSNRGCIIMRPVQASGEITDIKFTFSDGGCPTSDIRTSQYIKKFNELFKKAQGLEEFM